VEPAPFERASAWGDRELRRRIRGSASTRLALCAISARVLDDRCWRRLGFVRLSDFCDERPGISSRSLQEMACVDRFAAGAPRIGAAHRAGLLGWSALRTIARLERVDDEAAWLARAQQLPVAELAAQVRAEVARGSGSAVSPGSGADPQPDEETEEGGEPMEHVPVRCAPRVRAKWVFGCELTRRVVGRRLPIGECAEVIAAEVGSWLGHDPEGLADLHEPARPAARLAEVLPRAAAGRPADGGDDAVADPSQAAIEAELARLLEGLENASAFEVDRRLRRALELERTFEARIGPLLREVLEKRTYRRYGHGDRDRYVEERLGLCARKARSLVRIERIAARAPGLEAAYRSGRLSWVQTQTLVRLVEAGLRGAPLAGWLARATRVSARRLTDDVRQALVLRDTHPAAFAETGGLPREADAAGAPEKERDGRADAAGDPPPGATECEPGDGGERQTGAPAPGATECEPGDGGERQTGAHGLEPESVRVRFRASLEVGRFFRSVLDSVRRLLSEQRGAPASDGQALEAMLDHVIAVWCERDGRKRSHHEILARDGYRCVVPGCSSYRNLEVHHVVFRSEGGSDDPSNLVTLCAWHHREGVHGGRIRCWGRAPDRLHFALGLREGRPPLLVYGPGEVILEENGA